MCHQYTTNDSPELCECGCGLPAPIINRTNTRQGHIRGETARFINGHNLRGKARPPRKLPSLEERFWRKVDKNGPIHPVLKTACWLWQGRKTRPEGEKIEGYGVIDWANGVVMTHRVSYELHIGPIPEGKLVCHHCDYRPCSNPAHLFVGTHQDNMQDCQNKGRANSVNGERQHSAKLTREQVIEIRQRYAQGERMANLARTFKVSASTIQAVIHRKTWKHIDS